MPETPQFYRKIAALNHQAHRDWRVSAQTNYGFASETNAVLLTTVEFPLAACEFPIVFILSGTRVRPVAVMGLKERQNLFVQPGGGWAGRYIPAYVRRYPFILAGEAENSGQFTVCVDEDFAGFNREQGESLFEADGQHSPFLKRAVTFLQDYQLQGRRTEAFCEQLQALGVLDSMQANVAPLDGGRFSLAGFLAVNRQRLKALKASKLAEMAKDDSLELLYLHLQSLTNFQRLSNQLAKQA
jgi:hypothetical protein